MNRATEPTSQNKNALGDQSACTGRRVGRYLYAQELAYALRQHPVLTIMTDHAGLQLAGSAAPIADTRHG